MDLLRYILLISIEFLTLLNANNNFNDQKQPATTLCEPIKGECINQGYSFTSKSHLDDGSKFANQKAADATIKSYELMQPCSAYFKIFICATYKPSCYEEAALIIQPCRSMCEHVYRMCFPLMQRFKMKWSEELNCSRFLDDKSENCMKDPGYFRDQRARNDYLKQVDILLGKKFSSSKKFSPSKDVNIYSKYICYNNPRIQSSYQKLNNKCSLRCRSSITFSAANKTFARSFTAIISFISACLLFVALIGISIDKNQCSTNRFIILLSICYLIYSIITFISIQLGTAVITCHKLDIKRLNVISGGGSLPSNPVFVEIKSYIVKLQSVSENKFCIVTLILIYYFQTIALSLWTLMSLWWFLLVRFEVDLRRLKFGNVFYIVALVLPTIKSGNLT